MVIAHCFWVLIKFISLYLLALRVYLLMICLCPCCMPFLFLILQVFSWGPRQLCTFVSAKFSFVIYPHLRSFAKYTVPSVMYIRRSGVLILNHFWFFDLHPFKGFCQVYGFVSNVHPSRRNLITQPFIFVFLTYTHLRDFAKCMTLSVTYIRQGVI